jgi:Protein of unknown function (DUF2934)
MPAQNTSSKSIRKSSNSTRAVNEAPNNPLSEAATETSTERLHQGATPPAEVISAEGLHERDIPSFSDSRAARIAEAAYWRAERRGFAPGHELDDWLDAEREVDGGKSDRAK